MAQKPPPAEKTAPSFESALQRLEAIVGQMEEGQLPLEQLIDRFEEGSRLVKVCAEKLESAEKRIELLLRTPSGRPQVTEFEPAAATSAIPASPKPAATPAEEDEVSLF